MGTKTVMKYLALPFQVAGVILVNTLLTILTVLAPSSIDSTFLRKTKIGMFAEYVKYGVGNPRYYWYRTVTLLRW